MSGKSVASGLDDLFVYDVLEYSSTPVSYMCLSDLYSKCTESDIHVSIHTCIQCGLYKV